MNQLGTGGVILFCLAAACEAQIQVNVYNDAGVGDHALMIAQREATRILGEAGVTSSWCRKAVSSEPCPAPGPATIQVRLYPRGGESNFRAAAGALGFALTSPAPEFGFFVGVFSERVTEFGRRTNYSDGLVLGHVIAHELGHLLLERNAHSRVGLMKDSWDRPQRNLMATGRLLFSSGEARRLRENVTARVAAAERASDGK